MHHFFFALFLFPLNLLAQTWDLTGSFGGNGTEDCRLLAAGPEGFIVGGLYNEPFTLGSQTLPHQGGNDFFVGQLQDAGDWQWIVPGGSFLDDELTAIQQDDMGNTLVAGAYWVSMTLADSILESSLNPRGLFLAKFSPEGDLHWLLPFNGSGLKRISDIATDPEGNCYLTGHFGGQFSVQDTILQARGTTDLFLLKLNAAGKLQWIVHHGGKDDTRAQTLDLLSNGEIIAGGYYNDTTYLGDQVLIANTYDRDVWLARFSREGEVQWARRAGGVFDEEVTALRIDTADQIYVGGYLIGVMTLSESLSIESSNGNPDFYLLQYQPDGTPTRARAMGGDQTQLTTGMALNDQGPVLTGNFLGTFSVDGQSASAGNSTAGFIIGFNDEGEARWLETVRATDAAFIHAIAINTDNRVFVGGTFAGTITFGGTDLPSAGEYDIFIGGLARAITAVRTAAINRGNFAFPNPADTIIHIRTTASDFNLFLVDSAGRTLFTGQNTEIIPIKGFPPGIYTLWLETGNEIQTQKILITNQ